MRILFWEDKPNVYGGQRALISRCRRLCERKIQLEIFHSHKKSRFLAECCKLGLRRNVRILPAASFFSPVIHALWVLYYAHVGKYDIIHLDSFSTAYPISLLRWLTKVNVRVVFTVRSDRFLRFGWFDRLLLQGVNQIVANSEFTRRGVMPHVSQNDIPVHFSPIVFGRNRGDRHKQNDSRLDLGYIGSIEPRKNLLFLLDALLKNQSRLGPFQLLVGGTPKSRTDNRYYKECLKKAEKHDNIRFLGYVAPSALSSKISVLVCPYRDEPLGRVVPEFLYLGVPVVTSDSGGLQESSLGYAHIYKNDDQNDLIKGILLAGQEREQRSLNKEEVRQRISEYFSYKRIGDMDIELYQRLMKEE